MKISSFKLILPLLLVGLSVYGVSRIEDIPAGLGFAAKDICSRVFVSNDQADRVINRYTTPATYPLHLIWKISVDEEQKLVTVSDRLFSYSSQALFRENLGCTTVQGNLASLKLEAVEVGELKVLDLTLPWPQGASPEVAKNVEGVDYALLDIAIKDAFKESGGLSSPLNTHVAMVAYKGQVVGGRYAEGYSPEQLYIGWSMSKTITALVMGLLHKDGLVDIDAPAPIKSWQGTDKENITLRHILNMASGLEWDEGYKGKSSATQLFYQNKNSAEFVMNRPQASVPGESWVYSSGDTQLLANVIREKSGGTLQSAYDLYQQRLFKPLGIYEGYIEPDAAGNFIGAGMAHLKPRDWLRLGQLVLNKGSWNGKQLVAEEWIEFLGKPSPANSGYGGQSWLHDANMEKHGLPHDTFLFRGHLGQYVAVVPSMDLVYLRLGVGFDRDDVLDRYFRSLALVIEALESQ